MEKLHLNPQNEATDHPSNENNEKPGDFHVGGC